MSTRIVFEVRRAGPSYYTYDVEVHPEGHRRTRQASGGLRYERLAEQAAEQAIGALQVHLVGMGFEPLPVERRGLTPRARRWRAYAHAAGWAAGWAVSCLVVGGGVVLISSAIW